MKKYEPYHGRVKIGYCSKKHGEKDDTKRRGSISPRSLINTRNFIIVMGLPELIHILVLASCNINIMLKR